MALINIESAQNWILNQLKKTRVHQGVEVLSYKRNRGISLVRSSGDTVEIRERGYCDRELTVALAELPKLLRSMMRTEFPRSRKVRVCRLAGPEAAGREMKKL
jgi:hypothetical protein